MTVKLSRRMWEYSKESGGCFLLYLSFETLVITDFNSSLYCTMAFNFEVNIYGIVKYICIKICISLYNYMQNDRTTCSLKPELSNVIPANAMPLIMYNIVISDDIVDSRYIAVQCNTILRRTPRLICDRDISGAHCSLTQAACTMIHWS